MQGTLRGCFNKIAVCFNRTYSRCSGEITLIQVIVVTISIATIVIVITIISIVTIIIVITIISIVPIIRFFF